MKVLDNMAKYELRIKAREMRSRGGSVGLIAKKLGVSKSTVSLWVRDIILSVEQMERLKQGSIKGGELGRLKGSLMQKHRRLDMIEKMNEFGRKRFKSISDSEFFVAGIALYWGEGSKKKREFYICNSDPNLVRFMILWLKRFFGVGIDRLKAVVGINEIHRERDEIVKKYWSQITGIPLSQFRRTSFKKSKVHKVYENFNDHYGTLAVHILKGCDFYYKMLGLITGLSEIKLNKRVRQGSSVG